MLLAYPTLSASMVTLRRVGAVLAAAGTMLALDLAWIGKVGQPFYAALGPLQREEAYVPAAVAFYVMYLAAVVGFAVAPAPSVKAAAARGAGMGFVCYATYELTNWAVIAGWPASLVPVDIAWGVVLTGGVAAVGRAAWR